MMDGYRGGGWIGFSAVGEMRRGAHSPAMSWSPTASDLLHYEIYTFMSFGMISSHCAWSLRDLRH